MKSNNLITMDENIIESFINQCYVGIKKAIDDMGISTECPSLTFVTSYDGFSFYSSKSSFQRYDVDSISYISLFRDYVSMETQNEKITLDFRIRQDIFPPMNYSTGYDHGEMMHLIDCLSKVIDYGLNKLTQTVFITIKENDIQIDNITPILLDTSVKISKSRESMKEGDLHLDFCDGRDLSIILSFDLVNENDYMIGGKEYERGKNNFELQQRNKI